MAVFLSSCDFLLGSLDSMACLTECANCGSILVNGNGKIKEIFLNCPTQQVAVKSCRIKTSWFFYNPPLPIITNCKRAYFAKLSLMEEINDMSVRYTGRGFGRSKGENTCNCPNLSITRYHVKRISLRQGEEGFYLKFKSRVFGFRKNAINRAAIVPFVRSDFRL